MNPSPHLTWKELSCKDGTPYPEEFKRDGRVYILGMVFEAIRSLCGDKPIRILSAYRTPSHNRKIGGAKNSQHVLGRALDLAPPSNLSVSQFYQLIKVAARYDLPEVRGIGLYKTFVHVDIRPSERLILWKGAGVKDSIN